MLRNWHRYPVGIGYHVEAKIGAFNVNWIEIANFFCLDRYERLIPDC